MAPAINGSGGGKAALPESRMTRCLRLVVSTLQQAVPPPGQRSTVTPPSLDAFAALLTAALDGLMTLADLHPPNVRDDLYAVAFTFYARAFRHV